MANCVAGGTYIITESGFHKLKDLWPEELPLIPDTLHTFPKPVKIATDLGPGDATEMYYGGPRKVLVISFSSGITLSMTPEHILKVPSITEDLHEVAVWKYGCDLREGDQVYWVGLYDLSQENTDEMYLVDHTSIVSISDGLEDVYDIRVPIICTYITNGVVSHNS